VFSFFFFQAEDGIRDFHVTGVQTCALPIWRWFASPWPYLGGLVALLTFSPVIVWNAQNQWLSFVKQFGRADISAGFSLKYISERSEERRVGKECRRVCVAMQ